MTDERTYTIPLRREVLKAPAKKRAKKAVTAVKEFIKRHMKGDTIVIGNELNMLLWRRGIENPPSKVEVITKKSDDTVFVNLVGKPIEPVKIEQKTTQDKQNMLEEQLSKITGKKDKPAEATASEKTETAKKPESSPAASAPEKAKDAAASTTASK
jgi:large subunit ribosomal protein L31e